MIKFKAVSKRFADGTLAVDSLDLDVETGELTVLVGPSGCGKTTSLRMINRLEEPTAGCVEVDGDDVLSLPRTALRRGIGYVMQHAGLFPHRTTYENIATVPRLLGWDQASTRQRVDELIDLVGLRREIIPRYPHQLSGGQQQRVGVARALAADPPIMLMDEPFAAVDPIVRAHLQDEFLSLQERVKKTIVFVTHDIDEAIKLGDRIAIFQRGGTLAQYATPGALLACPVNEFVEDFLGAERELKRLALIPVAAVETDPGPVLSHGDSLASARRVARQHGTDWVIIVDSDGALDGWVNVGGAEGNAALGECDVHRFEYVARAQDSLRAALNAIVTSEIGVVPCIAAGNRYQGVLTRAGLTGQLR